MTSTERTIKKIATIFAWILVVCIIVSVVTTVTGILAAIRLFDGSSDGNVDFKTFDFSADKISSLNIEIGASELSIITKGDTIKVSTDNNRISVRESQGKLKIEEKNKGLFNNNKSSTVVIYIPENKVFKEVEMNTGAGSITIDSLSAEELEFNLGAGKTDIESLTTIKETKISGGTGEFTLRAGTLTSLELNWGVGNAEISAELLGNTEIESGVGSISLNMQGNADDYRISIEKGLGDITVDGKSISNNTILGSGINHIDIDSGIGNVDITFEQ